ncbi:PLP-dependent aminotransferase family protein [Aquincola sp. MAHUQ-54]|uniref:PLP-dependent aminotransferase family protein n=1 Tax=Aquincola agrisoli TaxID=3119538 RepID=A0AAW9QHC2_9BURK
MEADLLYQRVAQHYRSAIRSGLMPAGERMPSVRSLTRLHQVSLSTALQACRRLEDEGLLEARPRSGYFVRPPRRTSIAPAAEPDVRRAPDPAQFVGIHDRVSAFVATGELQPVSFDFGATYAEPGIYPGEALKAAAIRVLRRQPELLVRPVSPAGELALRTAIARRALDGGLHLSPDEITITHGCIEALNVALRAVAQPGDVVAVESPTYFGLLQVLESLGLRALEIPTSPHTGLSIEALELAFETQPGIKAVVASPDFQNPLGCVMPDADKARLVALCERRRVPLIEDDTYGMLGDDDTPLKPLKAWDTTGNVIRCVSLRKTVAPGLRLGWVSGGRLHARIQMLKYAQSRANEALGQLTMAEFLGSSAYDRHVARLRRQIKHQRERVAEAIAAWFPPGTRLSLPRGGMLLWVELPPGCGAHALFEAGMRYGIRTVPGTLFSNTHRYDHFLRISCGYTVTHETEQALRLLGGLCTAK